MAPPSAEPARRHHAVPRRKPQIIEPTLPPVPTLPEPPSAVTGLAMIALPVASGAGALVVALGRPGSAMAVGSLVVLIGSIAVGGLLLFGQRQGTAGRITRQRRRFLHTVHDVDEQLRRIADRRRSDGPARPSDAGDAPAVRLGAITAALPTPSPPANADALTEADPVCAAAVADLHARRGVAHDLPLDLPLASLRRMVVGGPADTAAGLLRRLVLDLAGTLPPGRLAIVVTGADREEWARWLPHCTRAIAQGRTDQPLRADLVDPIDDPWPTLLASAELEVILHLEWGRDRTTGASPPPLHLTAADRDPRVALWARDAGPSDDRPAAGTRVLTGPDDRLVVRVEGGPALTGRTTGLSAGRARSLARDIAHRSTNRRAVRRERTSSTGDPTTALPQPISRPVDGPDFLRAVIGRRSDGAAVELDLKDAAQDGMGPHGLIVGATGSGKSELLRTLVLRLTEHHDPVDLVLLLVDYKGGSTFAPFARMPHVAGLLTNLSGDQHLTERFAVALRGESTRRQAVLAQAGVSDIAAFRRLPDRQALPTMLVVVDEYTELLAAHADLAELFTGLGRVGRSLGLHLLLATQRLEPGRSRGVDGHLSYTVALRTFTAAESQELLGSTAAFTLPRTPGEALLVAAGEGPVRFRVDRCAPAARPSTSSAARSAPVGGPRPFPAPTGIDGRLTRLTRLRADPEQLDPEPSIDPDPVTTAVTALVARMTEHPRGGRARPVWLPPLPDRVAFDLLPVPESHPVDHRATLFLGLVDRPATQEQIGLSWTPIEEPNLAVSGTGRSGRSTALLTVIAAAAVAAGAGGCEVYGIARSGAALSAARDWPHVAGIAGPDEHDFAERLLRLVIEEIDRRERPPTAARTPSHTPAVRRLLLLVVDDWSPSGAPDGEIDRLVADVAARGPAVGVATAVATAAGMVLRGRVAAAFGTRIELRPTDAFESSIDRRLAATLPAGVPGRALVVNGIAQLAQAPDPGGDEPVVRDVHRRWAGRSVARRCPLPREVRLDELWRRTVDPTPPAAGSDAGWSDAGLPDGGQPPSRPGADGPVGLRVTLGVEEAGGPAVTHELGRPDAHLAVLGDPGSGRTTVLRSIALQVAHAGSPVVLVAVDPRGVLTAPGLDVGWSASARRSDEVGPVVADVLRYLTGADRTAGSQASANRAPVVVLVDDEELLAGALGHPLTPLLTVARSGTDLGLHLVVARSCGGFGRARFEPLHQMLSDLGTPTLLLSSSPDEGRLTHRLLPRPLPPGRAQWAVRGRHTRLLQTPLTEGSAGARIATRPNSPSAATANRQTVR